MHINKKNKPDKEVPEAGAFYWIESCENEHAPVEVADVSLDEQRRIASTAATAAGMTIAVELIHVDETVPDMGARTASLLEAVKARPMRHLFAPRVLYADSDDDEVMKQAVLLKLVTGVTLHLAEE